MRLIDADELLDEICRDQCERKYKDCDDTCPLAAYVENAPTVDGWISADTYPDMACHRYLLTVRNVHCGDMRVIVGYTGDGDTPWYTSDQICMEDYRAADNRLSHNYIVTHWMPLPEPPKEADNGG